MNMKKTNTLKGVNSMPAGNQDRDLHLSCVGADRVVASHWLAGFIQPEKRSYGRDLAFSFRNPFVWMVIFPHLKIYM